MADGEWVPRIEYVPPMTPSMPAGTVVDSGAFDRIAALEAENATLRAERDAARSDAADLRARLAAAEAALRRIVEYEPEQEWLTAEQLQAVEDCPDCAARREKPFLGQYTVCDRHLHWFWEAEKANQNLCAGQHMRMRDIARAALSGDGVGGGDGARP